MTVLQTYNANLKNVKKIMKNSTTTGQDELNKVCAKVLPNGKYKGAFPSDRLPSMKSTHCCILNLDSSGEPGSHWVGVYRTGKALVVYDSFGRRAKKILPDLKPRKGLKIANTELDAEQHILATDCGQRCVAWLMCVYSDGIKEALKV